MNVLIVSGISGSGKTTYLRALEDIGYFCVDNFPLILLKKFLELYKDTGDKVNNCAFVVDVREREFFKKGKPILQNIKENFGAKIIFLVWLYLSNCAILFGAEINAHIAQARGRLEVEHAQHPDPTADVLRRAD